LSAKAGTPRKGAERNRVVKPKKRVASPQETTRGDAKRRGARSATKSVSQDATRRRNAKSDPKAGKPEKTRSDDRMRDPKHPKMCKTRPEETRPKGGGGGGIRQFIPWCR